MSRNRKRDTAIPAQPRTLQETYRQFMRGNWKAEDAERQRQIEEGRKRMKAESGPPIRSE